MNKNKRGGAREGAGRKWDNHVKKTQMLVYLSADVANYIDKQTEVLGVSRGKVIDFAISNYVQDLDGARLEIY